jgi:hypothetical protein
MHQSPRGIESKPWRPDDIRSLRITNKTIPFKRHTRENGGSVSKPREAKRPVTSVGCNQRYIELTHQNAKARHRQNQIMNLLDPKIEGNISSLIHGITKERRDFMLDIAKSASNWQEFEAKLNAGGFPVAIKGEI